MKRKFNILISAVLILLILPLQFGCTKEKLQPLQTEEQVVAEEQGSAEDYTKSGFDPASAKYIDDKDMMVDEILPYWKRAIADICEVDDDYDAYICIESVNQLWEENKTMRADAAVVAVFLDNFDKFIVANKLLLGMKCFNLLVNVFAVPSNVANAVAYFATKTESIVSITLHACNLSNKTNICIEFPLVGTTDDGKASGYEIYEAIGNTGYHIFGDANEDKTINMQDVTYLELIILEYRGETEFADAKKDGKINMQDVTQVELMILGKQKEVYIGK